MGHICTSGQCLQKAGKNVYKGFVSGANVGYIGEKIDTLISGAESMVNGAARYNFSDNYAILNQDTKWLINDITTNIVAIYLISYDMSGYTSRVEAEDIINVLRDSKLMGLSILRDKKVQDFINAA